MVYLTSNCEQYWTLSGNSNYEYFHNEGCYVTTNANGQQTAVNYGKDHRNGIQYQYWTAREQIANPMTMNGISDIFNPNSGNWNQTKYMNFAYGPNIWDYWTRDNQTTAGLESILNNYANDFEDYMIYGIFDLSSVTENKAPNHMVGINSLPNEETGVFENITPSSQNDKARLADNTKKNAYSMKNLKKIIVVKLSNPDTPIKDMSKGIIKSQERSVSITNNNSSINIVFNNINFDGSSSIYIGFNDFLRGCSK